MAATAFSEVEKRGMTSLRAFLVFYFLQSLAYVEVTQAQAISSPQLKSVKEKMIKKRYRQKDINLYKQAFGYSNVATLTMNIK